MPRLPSDSVLIVADENAAAVPDSLAAAWRAAAMPMLPAGQEPPAPTLVARLEALGATTVVACGAGAGRVAQALVAHGFRVFVLAGEGGPLAAGEAARGVTLEILLAEAETVRRRAGRPWRRPPMTN